jgi:hypothetical protein
MTLEVHISAIQEGIRIGRFINEAAVSQGIVLRLLGALSWPTYDTEVVAPEYTVEGKRVDFALCYPPNKPRVFVEVKKVGQGEGAEKQLFEYAFYVGIPMAVLTDGQEWHFFLPGEQGAYEERRVYKLDILERDTAESAKRLARYLSYEAVCSGKAIEAAKSDYRNVTRQREIRANLPIAFAKLVQEQDEALIEILADKVESLCGYKPEPDVVAEFLVGGVPTNIDAIVSAQSRQSSSASIARLRQVQPSYSFTLFGKHHLARNATAVYLGIFEELSKRDPTFLPRFAALPKHGKKRRYVAQAKEELYPGRPDLVEVHSHRLSSGWWVGTNYSTGTKEKIIKLACEVGGLEYGTDLRVTLK